MKITYVSSARIPSERAYSYATVKLCSEFASLGHEVVLVAPQKKYTSDADIFALYRVETKFAFRKIPSTDFLGRRLARSSIPLIIDSLSFVWSMRRAKLTGDIFYIREYFLAFFLPKGRIVIEIHSIPADTFLFKMALQRARKIVIISDGLRKALISLGVPESKMLLAPDGADLAEFDSTVASRDIWKKSGVDPSRKIALYTGHLYEWKGADTFARAAQHARTIQCVLIGGVDEEFLAFKKRYTDPNITILPHVPHTRIIEYMKNADVLVLPNSGKRAISRDYTSPLKLFEYMACQKPIVASDLPSIREILNDASAFWFTPDDPKSCADAIMKAAEKTYLAHEKAFHARKKVEGYTWRARAENISGFITA